MRRRLARFREHQGALPPFIRQHMAAQLQEEIGRAGNAPPPLAAWARHLGAVARNLPEAEADPPPPLSGDGDHHQRLPEDDSSASGRPAPFAIRPGALAAYDVHTYGHMRHPGRYDRWVREYNERGIPPGYASDPDLDMDAYDCDTETETEGEGDRGLASARGIEGEASVSPEGEASVSPEGEREGGIGGEPAADGVVSSAAPRAASSTSPLRPRAGSARGLLQPASAPATPPPRQLPQSGRPSPSSPSRSPSTFSSRRARRRHRSAAALLTGAEARRQLRLLMGRCGLVYETAGGELVCCVCGEGGSWGGQQQPPSGPEIASQSLPQPPSGPEIASQSLPQPPSGPEIASQSLPQPSLVRLECVLVAEGGMRCYAVAEGRPGGQLEPLALRGYAVFFGGCHGCVEAYLPQLRRTVLNRAAARPHLFHVFQWLGAAVPEGMVVLQPDLSNLACLGRRGAADLYDNVVTAPGRPRAFPAVRSLGALLERIEQAFDRYHRLGEQPSA